MVCPHCIRSILTCSCVVAMRDGHMVRIPFGHPLIPFRVVGYSKPIRKEEPMPGPRKIKPRK